MGRVFIWAVCALVVAVRADWMQVHMQNEHLMDTWDDDSFFRIHDLNSDGTWTDFDIRSLYGLENNPDVSPQQIQHVEDTIFRMIPHTDRVISLAQFREFRHAGGSLPDLGFEGHHDDEEMEFDIHHVQKFHSDPSGPSEEFWNHPEDIEHFRKHNEMYHQGHEPGSAEASHEHQHGVPAAGGADDPVRNIPLKYRRTI